MMIRGLYPIVSCAGEHEARGATDLASAIVSSGVKVLQLRVKGLSDRRFHELASSLRDLTRAAGVALVINDRADIAALVGADGVHLGTDDLPLAAARRILPPGAWVGISTDSPEEARSAAAAGADYIAWGAVWPTASKTDAAVQDGPRALAAVRAAIPKDSVLVAIGGITRERIAAVRAAGADAFAVIGALRDAANPAAEARALLAAWEAA